MRTVFMGGKQAGCVGLLTLVSLSQVKAVVPYDQMVGDLADSLKLPQFRSIHNAPAADLIVSVHGRELVPASLFPGINVHPCLNGYKGADPVRRFLADGNTRASVGVHRMTETVDDGEVLAEVFVDVEGCTTVEEVYNMLYPAYIQALLKAWQELPKVPALDRGYRSE